MNELKLSGKVLNSYINEDGFLTLTIAVPHDHVVNGYNHVSESVFRIFLPDREKSLEYDVQVDDQVEVSGHLKQDRKLTRTGNEHKRINIYISSLRKL